MEKLQIIIDTIPNRNETPEYDNIIKYLQSLDETEQITILIAFEHLDTSFSIIKSNGFAEFKKFLAQQEREKQEITTEMP